MAQGTLFSVNINSDDCASLAGQVKITSALEAPGDEDTVSLNFTSLGGPQIPTLLYSETFGDFFQNGAPGFAGRLRYFPDRDNPGVNPTSITSEDSPKSLGIQSDDQIELMIPLRAADNPIIYLIAPQGRTILASVSVGLVPQWEFSVIYPIVPVHGYAESGEMGRKGQQITWNVRTHEDGSLTELNTGVDVSYLFWEAIVPWATPPSPPMSPNPAGGAYFDPATCTVSCADSVLLPVTSVTPYLDAALKALCLHTAARTAFICYWLPMLLKHTFVALRFVSQAAFERAAPLTVDPKPDVVTRVFMLWKGIDADEVGLEMWEEARQRAQEDPTRWNSVVGIDETKARDESLFRVLEWGGMDVLYR